MVLYYLRIELHDRRATVLTLFYECKNKAEKWPNNVVSKKGSNCR